MFGSINRSFCKLPCDNEPIDGDICLHCSLICSSYATEKIDTLIKFWQINDDRLSEFKKSQVLSEFGTNTITMDYKNKFFILGNLNQKRPIVYAFNEIDYYEYEDIPIGIFETKKRWYLKNSQRNHNSALGIFIDLNTAKSAFNTKAKGRVLNLFLNTYIENKKITIIPPTNFSFFFNKCIFINNINYRK